jgi:AbrB family looped-hinge helix DNA binding protein
VQTSKLTVKGQMTIPIEIRKQLGVGAGSQVGFYILSNGEVTLIKIDTNKSIAGLVKNKIKNIAPVSIEDTNKAISSGWQDHECD